jgi:hypothetical protein
MEMLALSSGGVSEDRAFKAIRNGSQRGKKPMSDEHKQKLAKSLAKSREDRQVHRKDNRMFLDLGDIRIIRVDDICLAVEMKRNKVWDLKGYYGSPIGAIEKVINISIDVNHKLALKEFVEHFYATIGRLLELASVQAKKFEHDADAKHAKQRGGKK